MAPDKVLFPVGVFLVFNHTCHFHLAIPRYISVLYHLTSIFVHFFNMAYQKRLRCCQCTKCCTSVSSNYFGSLKLRDKSSLILGFVRPHDTSSPTTLQFSQYILTVKGNGETTIVHQLDWRSNKFTTLCLLTLRGCWSIIHESPGTAVQVSSQYTSLPSTVLNLLP